MLTYSSSITILAHLIAVIFCVMEAHKQPSARGS